MIIRNILALLAILFIAAAADGQDGPSIGYPSVSAALESLSEDPAVEFGEESGWRVADAKEGNNIVLWTFTSSIHEAHPSAVKRIMYQEDGAWRLEMRVLCEAEQPACDELVAEFQNLNDSMRRNIERLKQNDLENSSSHEDPGTTDRNLQR